MGNDKFFARTEHDLRTAHARVYKYLYESNDTDRDRLDIIGKYLFRFPEDRAMIRLRDSLLEDGALISVDRLVETRLLDVPYSSVLEDDDDYIPTYSDAKELVEELYDTQRALEFRKSFDSLQTKFSDVSKDKVMGFLAGWSTRLQETLIKRERSVREIYEDRKRNDCVAPFFVTQVDELMRGVMKGRVAFIGGAPGHGKSTFMTNMMYRNVVDRKLNVVYITLEQGKEDFKLWLACRHSLNSKWANKYHPISRTRIEFTDLRDDEQDYYSDVISPDLLLTEGRESQRCADYGNLTILDLSDFQSMDPDAVRERIREADPDVDVIFIDYIQVLKNFPIKGFKDNELVNHYIQRFRTGLAEDFFGKKTALIIGSQINREGQKQARNNPDREDGMYELRHFAEANEIERGAWYAMMLYTSDTMSEMGELQIQILKYRTGRAPSSTPILTKFTPEYMLVGTDEAYAGNGRTSVDTGAGKPIGTFFTQANQLIDSYRVGGKYN